MSDKGPFEVLMARLLGGAPRREDGHDLTLARPHQPAPLLVQGGDAMVALALGLELVAALGRRGGIGVKASVVEPLHALLRERFGDSAWAHLEEELVLALDWMEQALAAERDAEGDESLVFDPAPRRALVQQALVEERDLFVEYLRVDDRGRQRFHRTRLRPEGLEDRPGPAGKEPVPSVIGRSVPGGELLVVALEQLRWLMVVKRFSVLREASLARVLTFRGSDGQGGDGPGGD